MSRTPLTYHFDPGSNTLSVDGNSYYMNTLTYTTDTNVNAFQPSYPSPAEQAPKKEEVLVTKKLTYQVEFTGSQPNEIVEDVTQTVHDGAMITFYGEGQTILRSFPTTNLFAYGVVADPEKIVTPKYLFRLRLADDSTKEIAADLYVITKSGDEDSSVYEFFTSLSENGTKTRSELAIPYGAVKYVERVELEKATGAVVDSPRTGGRLMNTEDYGDASAKR